MKGYWASHEYKRLSVDKLVEEFCGWILLLEIIETVKGKGSRVDRNRGFLATLFETGGRVSEVLALRKSNFELRKDENLILVRDMPLFKRYRKVQEYVDEKGKKRWVTEPEEATRRSFPIVLDEPLVPYMLKWIDQCEDLLFPSPYKEGEPLSRIWGYRFIRRLNDKLDERIKRKLGFVNRKGEEVAHLFLHWLRSMRASELVYDYGFEIIDLLDFFTWEKHDTALNYARKGWKGLANKMRGKVKYA